MKTKLNPSIKFETSEKSPAENSQLKMVLL